MSIVHGSIRITLASPQVPMVFVGCAKQRGHTVVQDYATSCATKEELISGAAIMVLTAPEAVIIVTEVTLGIGAMLLLVWYYVHARRRRKKQWENFVEAEKQRWQRLRRDETLH